jgi:hypothetical protein
MKLLSDNLTYGYPINKRKSLINDNVHTTKLSIEHPSAFCQFDTCRGKNLIINDAHIMSECKHTPLKEIRHKIRREARKTIVKLMGENDEEKRKLKGSIKKLGNWWGNKSNYEKYKERKRNTKPTEEKTKWTKLPLNFIQTLDYKDIQKRSNNNNSGIYENTLRKQVNKSITEIEMENEMNNTIYNRRELNNENGKKINGKTYRNEDQLQATHNPPKKKKIDINKDKTNVIKIKNNTQIVSTGNIYKYNSNNTHSNTNNNSPPQTNNNTNNNINNTNNDNRKQISKPRIKYYNMYDILNEKNYNEQKINIGMKVNENRNNIKKTKDTPKKKKIINNELMSNEDAAIEEDEETITSKGKKKNPHTQKKDRFPNLTRILLDDRKFDEEQATIEEMSKDDDEDLVVIEDTYDNLKRKREIDIQENYSTNEDMQYTGKGKKKRKMIKAISMKINSI